MSKQNAMTALALIDQVAVGVGGYRDENITAVAQVKAWLRQIATGQLVVAPAKKSSGDAQKDLQQEPT